MALGEIRLRKDLDKDTRNLGKCTLCQLLDFCLLKTKRKEFFPFMHDEIFHDYVFYLEIQLTGNRCLTIRHDVAEASRIWLYVTAGGGLPLRGRT